MAKKLRKGKVFVDWSQNDQHKTTVAVYSLRARERPTVSTPVEWEEVEDAAEREDPTALSFEASEVLERVGRPGDLFAPVLELEQELPDDLARPRSATQSGWRTTGRRLAAASSRRRTGVV